MGSELPPTHLLPPVRLGGVPSVGSIIAERWGSQMNKFDQGLNAHRGEQLSEHVAIPRRYLHMVNSLH
jgi:hypothetical protein